MNDKLFEDLINDLIYWGNMKEDLWKHHPDNPEKVNIVEEYNKISEKLRQVQHLIEQRKINK